MTQIPFKCISTSETEFSVSLSNGKFCMSTSCVHYEQSLCTVSHRRECHIQNTIINNPPTKLRTVQIILKTKTNYPKQEEHKANHTHQASTTPQPKSSKQKQEPLHEP